MHHEEIIRRITVAMEEAETAKQRYRDRLNLGSEYAWALGVLEGQLVALVRDLRKEANEASRRELAAIRRKGA